ncbi:alpha/beta fold hydrolase [Colwellia sp. MEBiC06753]
MNAKISKHYQQTAYGQIHYLAAGNVENPSLVLLHQTPSTGEMFRSMMSLLADDFYCIAPDFIGFGQSDLISEKVEHSINLYADSVLQTLTALGIEQARVFGHHSGAAVAVELTALAPQLVNKLILSGPTLLPEPLKQSLPASVVDNSLDEQGEFLQRYWQKIRAKDPNIELTLTLRETITALALGDNYRKAYQAVAEHDFAKRLTTIHCPTLVFAGNRDVLQPFVDDTLALLADGYKAEIGDSSTYVCETHAGEVAQLIKEF